MWSLDLNPFLHKWEMRLDCCIMLSNKTPNEGIYLFIYFFWRNDIKCPQNFRGLAGAAPQRTEAFLEACTDL